MLKNFSLLFLFLFLFLLSESQNIKLVPLSKESTDPSKADGLWTADWSADKTMLAFGGDDSLLWIYKGKIPQVYKVFKLKAMVRSIAWHPTENLMAVSSSDTIALLVDPEKNTATVINGVKHGARGIAWNHDGSLLAAASGGGTVVIWNRKGEKLRTIAHEVSHSHSSIAWHPKRNEMLVGGDQVLLYDTSGNELLRIKSRSQEIWILTVDWHPDGTRFAFGEYGHGEGELASLIHLYSTEGRLINTLKGSKAEYRNVRWSPDGKYLASASDALRIWSKEGKLLHTAKSPFNLWGLSWKDRNSLVTTTFSPKRVVIWNSKAKGLIKVH